MTKPVDPALKRNRWSGRSPIDRMWDKVQKTPTCWLWTGGLDKKGYGHIYPARGQQERLAHRAVFRAVMGDIPEGMELDHLCRVPRCVNPAHLEPVTHRENRLRSLPFLTVNLLTHCKRGHLYDEANTYRWRGERKCRACRAIQGSLRRAAA